MAFSDVKARAFGMLALILVPVGARGFAPPPQLSVPNGLEAALLRAQAPTLTAGGGGGEASLELFINQETAARRSAVFFFDHLEAALVPRGAAAAAAAPPPAVGAVAAVVATLVALCRRCDKLRVVVASTLPPARGGQLGVPGVPPPPLSPSPARVRAC